MPATTRERIIETSSALFMQQGFSASGLKEIATESDTTIGSIYHFFPGGKQELAAETLRASGRAYAELVGAILATAPDVVTATRWCFEGAAQTLVESDYADACPIATIALEVASSDDELRRVTDEIFQSWLDALRLFFGNDDVATVILAALEGGFLLSRAAKSPEPMLAIGRQMVELVRRTQPATPSPSRRRRARTSRSSTPT